MGLLGSRSTAVEQAVERARFSVRELTGSTVRGRDEVERVEALRVQRLRDVGADELADAREDRWEGLS